MVGADGCMETWRNELVPVVQQFMDNNDQSVASYNTLLQNCGMAGITSSNRPLAIEDLDGGDDDAS